jgi:hypothetical protein
MIVSKRGFNPLRLPYRGEGADSLPCRTVNDRGIQIFLIGLQIEQQLKYFVAHLIQAGIRPINLIYNDNYAVLQ